MLSALPALIVVLIRHQMPESDVWEREKQLHGQAGEDRRAALSEMLGPALRRTTTIAFALTAFNMAAYWFKTIWLPTYFTTVRGLPSAEASSMFYADQLGSVIGYVCFGFAADRFGRRPSFTVFSCLKAVGLLMITMGWDAVSGNRLALLGFMFVLGLGEGNWGCIGPLLNELFPTKVRGAAIGIIYNLARGVQFLAPVVITWVATFSSFGAGIALAAPFAILAGATVWLLPETKGVKLVSSAEPVRT
jgi:MFS family permease